MRQVGGSGRMDAGATGRSDAATAVPEVRAGAPDAVRLGCGRQDAVACAEPRRPRLVVGVSGASGAALGLACLDCLRTAGVESHLVLTHGAELTIEQELGMDARAFARHADVVYDNRNIGAAIASGTFAMDGMIVAPCSMKTLAGIACGYSENLLLRAADVQMKEQRRLVLMVRETPLSVIHAENMARVARVPGVMLMPPLLTFYNGPQTIEDMVHHMACKALAAFGIEGEGYRRWS